MPQKIICPQCGRKTDADQLTCFWCNCKLYHDIFIKMDKRHTLLINSTEKVIHILIDSIEYGPYKITDVTNVEVHYCNTILHKASYSTCNNRREELLLAPLGIIGNNKNQSINIPYNYQIVIQINDIKNAGFVVVTEDVNIMFRVISTLDKLKELE